MNDLAKYLREVRSCLPGTRKQTRGVTDLLQSSLLADAGDLSYAQLVERFGTPAALAATQIETMPAIEIAEKVRFQNWLKKTIVIVAAVLILLVAGLCMAEYIDGHKSTQGSISKIETIHMAGGTVESTE